MSHSKMTARHSVVLFSTDTRNNAASLTREAVVRRMAAGGHVAGPVLSTYWWQGELKESQEWMAWFETKTEDVEALTEFLIAKHPYVTPAVITLPITHGYPGFLQWIAAEATSH